MDMAGAIGSMNFLRTRIDPTKKAAARGQIHMAQETFIFWREILAHLGHLRSGDNNPLLIRIDGLMKKGNRYEHLGQ